jgi:hypothetical protein
VSSARVAAAVAERFEVLEERRYGGTLLRPLLEGIAANFATGREEDACWLRTLISVEEILIREGVLESDHAVFVARNTRA